MREARQAIVALGVGLLLLLVGAGARALPLVAESGPAGVFFPDAGTALTLALGFAGLAYVGRPRTEPARPGDDAPAA